MNYFVLTYIVQYCNVMLNYLIKYMNV